MISFSLQNASNFIRQHELELMQDQVSIGHRYLQEKTGPGSEFLGWYDQPVAYDQEELERILDLAESLKGHCDILVCAGIGGSYLGAQAVLDALSHSFAQARIAENEYPQVIFCGNNLSATYLADLFDLFEGRDICVNVISKSGTTTETAIAFRILKNYLEERYGKEEAKKRIFVTTDKAKGALKTLAEQEGYAQFVVPDEIGGRYSVLTAVGLLPLAVAGIDVKALLAGAAELREHCQEEDLLKNPAYLYAATRTALYRKGYKTEILVNYEPGLATFAEWWKQLYGESDGKDQKGLFPASVLNTTDLHSMGQYIQDGQRNLFETVIWVNESRRSYEIPLDEQNLDGLNYLAGTELHEVNYKAMQGTVLAHVDGGVPNLRIDLDRIDEKSLGQFIQFFEIACAMSGYLNAINPFDQPGVEAYKVNMFALLGKEGYEEERQALLERLEE